MYTHTQLKYLHPNDVFSFKNGKKKYRVLKRTTYEVTYKPLTSKTRFKTKFLEALILSN